MRSTAERLAAWAHSCIPTPAGREIVSLALLDAGAATAAVLLDGRTGFVSFTDEAVAQPTGQHGVSLVGMTLESGGTGLLDGGVEIEVSSSEDTRPGASDQTSTGAQLREKLGCL
jgi:hypothetical protein